MTRLLVTGAGGFLGSHVVQDALDHTDWEVVALDSFTDNGITDRLEEAIQASRDTAYDRIQVEVHDLRAPVSRRLATALGDVDYAVHAAARCSVDDSIEHPREHVLNNVAATLTVLDWARETPALRRLVHVSTDEVYGAGSFGEHRPSSPYAASKAACEDIAHAYRETSGVPVTIVNSANLYGPRQSQRAFVPRLVRLISAGRPVTIHTDGSGTAAWRNYTYAPDLAAWLVRRLPQLRNRTYPLQGPFGVDVHELAKMVADAVGMPLDARLVPGVRERPGWDRRYRALPADPEAEWEPGTPSHIGIDATVEWFLARPEWLAD